MSDIFPPRMSIEGQLTAAADRIKKLEAQLAELNSPVVLSEWQEQQVRIAELEAQLAESEEIIVCLQTDMPMAERLLNQRGTINKLEQLLFEYEAQLADAEEACRIWEKADKDAYTSWRNRAEKAESQLAEVVLVTCAKHSPRTINEIGCPYCQTEQAESQLAEYHKQIPHLLRFVPPQNHDPLCRLHNDAVDYLLESIKGEDS